MKRFFLIAGTVLTLVGAAQAGEVAGARDGGYRAADGDFIDVASSDDRLGLDGLDCLHPVVQGTRIVSRECWANGHLGGGVEGDWKVEGDVVIFRGKRFTRLPSAPAKTAQAKPVAAMRVDPTGRPWKHNGSVGMIDPATGVIAYQDPIRAIIPAGTVLFRGQVHPHRMVVGTAYAFKAGCPAAPYPVRGAYAGLDTLTLRGAGPVRNGCDVVDYSKSSPHSVLKFFYLLDD